MLISTEILNFHPRFKYLVPYFKANKERIGYTDLHIEMLDKLWQEWNRIYKKYTHPLYNGTVSVTLAMNNCYSKAYKFVTMMKKRAAFAGLKLTAEDNAYLELNTNTKSVGRIEVTPYAPLLLLMEVTARYCKFFAIDPKNLRTKEKPKGAANIGIMIAYTAKGAAAPALGGYKKITPSKKSIFEVPVPADKKEMTLYIIVYYISPTGEEGKPSLPLVVKLS